jgi:tRNA (guanine-N7-)-methyltransferase
MKEFPLEYESKKEVLFHPGKPESFDGDILEIGPGRGDFLLSAAEQLPEKKLVAIELGKRRHFKLIPRIEKKGLANILLIQGNARIVLPRYFKPETFEKTYVLFPDPWPKKRHYMHRLMTVEFITLLAEFLKIGGELYFATDFWPYADWVVDNVAQVPQLKSQGKPFFTTIDEMAYYSPSFFEQKWRNEGRAIYYMRYEKIPLNK